MRPITIIKFEFLPLAPVDLVMNGRRLAIHLDCERTVEVLLPLVERPDAHSDLDSVRHLFGVFLEVPLAAPRSRPQARSRGAPNPTNNVLLEPKVLCDCFEGYAIETLADTNRTAYNQMRIDTRTISGV